MATKTEGAKELEVQAEPAGDLRSAEQIALTSHLAYARVPKDETAEEEEADEVELGELKLPKTAKLTHQLLQEILVTEPQDTRAGKLKQAKLRVVRAHLSELEQGAAAPVITSAMRASIAGVQTSHAHAIHLNRLGDMHPEVKELLKERDGLAAENAAAKTALATIAKAALEAKDLATLQKTISELTKPE